MIYKFLLPLHLTNFSWPDDSAIQSLMSILKVIKEGLYNSETYLSKI